MRSIFKSTLFLIYNLCAASYHEQYRVPQKVSDRSESYLFNDREYIIQNLPATWENAKIICGGHHNATLAVLDTRKKAEFLAEALSESQFAIDSIWVGARRPSTAGEYRWWHGVELQRTQLDVLDSEDQEPGSRYPVWVNRTRVPVPPEGADCVALERVHHDRPLLLDLPCSLERAFACERDVKKEYQIVQVNSVRCATGVYKIYDGVLQWEQAAAYCLLRRMTLANIPSTRCLKKLGMAMLKTRPSIESAWVGARGALGQWSWVDTGVSILQTPTYSDSGDWPPLRYSTPLKQTGCLQVDRHASRHPVLMEARCDRRMQFVCQTGVKPVPPAAVSDDQYSYSVVRQKLFWQHAYDNCRAMNGSLATVDTRDVLVQLMLLMGEDRDEPIHHIWISGRLNLTRDDQTGAVAYAWHNPADGRWIPDRSFGDTNGLFIPPWLDEEYSMDSPCLNLDRQDHMNALVYGLPCDTPQYSVCMIEKSPKEAVGAETTTQGY